MDLKIPKPFDKYYEIGMLHDGSIPEEDIPDAFDNYGGMKLLAVVYAKEQYEDDLGNNSLDYCFLVEDGNNLALVTTVGPRVYYVDIDEVRSCVNKDVDEDGDAFLVEDTEMSDAQRLALKELDSCLEYDELTAEQHALAYQIQWDINFEDVLLFINGIDIPLEDVKHVAYGECEESEFDGCYEVTLRNGSVKNYGWHDFDREGRLTPIADTLKESKDDDEFFDIQDIISQALNSIGGDMDDVTGGITSSYDEDRLLLSLYSTTARKDAAKFQKKFFETIEAALAGTRFKDVSRDEDRTYAYRLTRHNIEDMLGSERAKEFLEKFAMFEILITAYGEEEKQELTEWNQFSDDDVEDDIMHANVYGGDTKYCRHCGELKIWDADGFSYCPECDGDSELTETYWIDNKPVMDKVAELQAELEADGWTQNGDRYTGSKYYSFYMKRGDGKALWKAIRYSHHDEPEIIDVTYRQAIGSEPLDSIDGLRRTLGKMLLPNNESVEATKNDKEDVDLNESPRGFYVTTYYPDERWSPEEGGTMDYGWQANKSTYFRTEEEARDYMNDQLVGMSIKTSYDDSHQFEDEYGDLKMIAVEPSGKRGRWHAPARTWAEVEFDVPAERPYFDRRGDRVERNPRLVAKERKDRKKLFDEYKSAVESAVDMKELISIIADPKYYSVSRDESDRMHKFVVDRIQKLHTDINESVDSLRRIVSANLSRVIDKAFEEGLSSEEMKELVVKELEALLAEQIADDDAL